MSIRNKILHFANHSSFSPFIPKLFTCLLEGYSKKQFSCDLFAGITVGIVALPLAMAFAIGAGLDPERGIQTAIVAGFLTSIFSGSRFLIGGPEGAFVMLMFAIMQKFGIEGLLCATLTASVLLLILGLARCGALVRFISYPVIVGFTTGLGIVLLLSQLQDFFGIILEKSPTDIIDRVYATISFASSTNFYTLSIGSATIILILLLKKISPRFPNVITALVIVTLISYFFNLPIETIQSKFGTIPRDLPSPHLPQITLELFRKTFPDGISIALLCAIEALLTCVIADSITGTRHKSNCELIAQGIANFGSVLYGGIPSTGAIARTSVNIQLNAQTPMSGIIHSLTLLLLLKVFAPYASQIPLTALSAVLVFVAVRMIEFDQIRQVIASGWSEAAIMLSTALITVFVNINTAVEVGVFLTIIIFLKKSQNATRGYFLFEDTTGDDLSGAWKMTLPSDTKVYEIEGPFFFAVSDMLSEVFHLFTTKPKTLILRMRSVSFVDGTGVEALRRFFKQCEASEISLFFVEIRPDVLRYLEHSGFFETVSRDRVSTSIEKALLCTQKNDSIQSLLQN